MVKRPNAFLTFVLLAGCAALVGCPAAARPPQKAVTATVAPTAPRWRLLTPRGASTYLKLELPVVISGTQITIGTALSATPAAATNNAANAASTATEPSPPLAPTDSWQGSVSLFSTHLVRGPVEGPLVEQLSGQPRQSTDAGSYLVPLKREEPNPAQDATTSAEPFVVGEPMPLYMKVTVPATTDPGTYVIPVQIAAPGKPVESASLAVEVTDIALPTAPRVLAVATTNLTTLGEIYPETFGSIAAQYLDRADVDARGAVLQLDALVKAARAEGVALFVEDIVPVTHVDEMGQVTLDWDAYDRLMQPYMDGTAFEDRVPLPVWLAPVPPRRIRDSSTQLWQYMEQCAKHFAEKKWVAVPAFMHPALAGGSADEDVTGESDATHRRDADGALQAQVSQTMRLHMPRDMLAVAAPGAEVPHGQLWTVNDEDPRLPPAGALASEYSVRAWPWMCVARGNESGAGGMGGDGGSPTGVKGLVWRDALSGAGALTDRTAGAGANVPRPLFVVDKGDAKGQAMAVVGAPGRIMPTLRMTWLEAGLTDASLLGLLERRADTNRAGMVEEILAGMAGRAGIADSRPLAVSFAGAPAEAPDDALLAPPGFLYAGWPADKELWSQVTPNLQKLVLAADPGTRGAIKPDDPLYLNAKLWLAVTRRPVARIGGYDFTLRQGVRGDAILDARARLLVENPVNLPADMDLRFHDLPGDFQLVLPRARATQPAAADGLTPAANAAPDGADDDAGALRRLHFSLPGSSLAQLTLPLAGHVSELMQHPEPDVLEIAERYNGATLPLPVQLPIYRMHALESGQSAPKLDGKDVDWPLDNMTRVFGEMPVATRYLARPDLLAGTVRADEHPAHIRWTYDNDFLYLLAVCPQDGMSDDRNTQWPVVAASDGGVRWWGSDGVQIELAALPGAPNAGAGELADRIVRIAFKPAGVMLVQTGQISRDAKGPKLTWKEGPPPALQGAAAGVKYGISVQRQAGRVSGYTIEAAIPRRWVDAPTVATAPATQTTPLPPGWRINVLRHRAGDLVSSSWSGPVVEDDDVGMMGAMVGE